jgi:hypothetical protein
MHYRKPSNFSRMERGATGAPTLPRELVVLVAHRVFVFTILLLLLLLYTYTYIIRVYSTLLYSSSKLPSGAVAARRPRASQPAICCPRLWACECVRAVIVRYPLCCAVAVFISSAIVVRNTNIITTTSLRRFEPRSLSKTQF